MNIAVMRSESQQLLSTSFRTGHEMVSWFGAIQGQEYAQTKWGLGLRLNEINDGDIEKELSDGNLLRTHLLRPTWHFVSRRDIWWLLKLTAPRVNQTNSFMYKNLELDDKTFKITQKILIKLLQGGKQLTRDEINREFTTNKIFAQGHRLSYIMMKAELDGIICSGARKGNQFTYAMLEERAGENNSKTKDESLAELTKRFFYSRGPATIYDFATWSGLTLSECKEGMGLSLQCFEKFIQNNYTYYFSNRPVASNKALNRIFLLPPYDEYIMGYKDRSAIFEFKNSVKPDLILPFFCTIIHNGQIIGTWRRELKKKIIGLEINLFTQLNSHQHQALKMNIERFGSFNQLPVNLKVTQMG